MARMLPNMNEVTSVFNPLVIDVTMIPIASELLEINAMAASPFKLDSPLTLSKRKAASTQIGMENPRGAQFIDKAIAIVPKPT